ncbi:helix-turn-helix domain-containing protein [Sphingomonas sp. MMS24-J45]|uniref:helix-turn-helix domain-containing protein n=1 Tax=Sphingomonas sp. MMS24-J45 TaxID=3238806 RepID=UPI00384BF606
MGSQTKRSKPRLADTVSALRRPDPVAASAPSEILLDPDRPFIFPNRVREQRRRHGLQKLMALSNLIADIPYIRLSKIERGEVVARADELVRIAGALGIAPETLLLDVDAPGFDIATWADPFRDLTAWNEADEREAVLLAAALRVRRSQDRALTIAVLDRDYGLPAVILSRIENAQKPLDRWNSATLASLCRVFQVEGVPALRAMIAAQYNRGELDGFVRTITDPDARLARSRERIAALKKALSGLPENQITPSKAAHSGGAPLATYRPRELRVHGTALAGGLIDFTASDEMVEAPTRAGPRAFALRVCRATLGAGLPAAAVVVVDPDRPAVAGGLAAIRVGKAYRLVTVTFDRNGATTGYSVSPDMEINLDTLDPADVAGVIGAIFP